MGIEFPISEAWLVYGAAAVGLVVLVALALLRMFAIWVKRLVFLAVFVCLLAGGCLAAAERLAG
jgi:hypothetical protein